MVNGTREKEEIDLHPLINSRDFKECAPSEANGLGIIRIHDGFLLHAAVFTDATRCFLVERSSAGSPPPQRMSINEFKKSYEDQDNPRRNIKAIYLTTKT